MAGETEVSALDASVATFDAVKESAASDKAAHDTDAAGDTPPAAVDALSDDGMIRNDADVAAESARVGTDTTAAGKGGE